ncbi:hypothetical protein E2C01_002097 [Portunus trituberculatus]|uniref:Uncharacterized protein n=1 Tax=Portunus trituberculatus TaxID=210409 RepID=A0A5B7CL80_PORTR|nr:hypothetical protein [Portunus trituberculatus]
MATTTSTMKAPNKKGQPFSVPVVESQVYIKPDMNLPITSISTDPMNLQNMRKMPEMRHSR